MSDRFGAETLILIPCCKRKRPGGKEIQDWADPLSDDLTPECYATVLAARQQLLRCVKRCPAVPSGTDYSKNKDLKEGPDFGGRDKALYLPALERYKGNLYSKEVVNVIKDTLERPHRPRILILSALYGPLHPYSRIQDYDLKMSDPSARETWRTHFKSFLREYAKKNGIALVVCYFGKSTEYLKVAKEAIKPLLAEGIRGIQYHVQRGNSSETPKYHGRRLVADLRHQPSDSCAGRVVVRPLDQN
ncbi:MAG: peroxide stress protein YaaA [Thermoguttaceae bacterium]